MAARNTRTLPIHLVAAITVTLVLVLFGIAWSIPEVGCIIDLRTGEIVAVQPGRPAERAGLAVGDVIVEMFGYTWKDAPQQVLLSPIFSTEQMSVATPHEFTVLRDSRLIRIDVRLGAADAPRKLKVGLEFLICAVFWLCGYVLWRIKSQQRRNIDGVALFWMALAASLATFFCFGSVSLILQCFTQLLMLVVFVPLSVVIYAVPTRLEEPLSNRSTDRTPSLLFAVASGIALLCGWMYVNGMPFEALDLINLVFPAAVSIAVLLIGVRFFKIYRATNVAYVRRNIRIIVSTFILVGSIWILARTAATLMFGATLLPNEVIDALAILIPISYLVGGSFDNYQTDIVVRNICVYVFVFLLLYTICQLALRALGIGEPFLGIFTFFGLVMGFGRVCNAILSVLAGDHVRYAPLQRLRAQLNSSLELDTLATYVVAAIEQTFHTRDAVVYALDDPHEQSMTLSATIRQFSAYPSSLTLPHAVTAQISGDVIQTKDLLEALTPADDHGELATLIARNTFAILCLLRDEYRVWGVILLGAKGDLDSYRAADLRELGYVVDVARLAFKNSAAYREKMVAELAIKELLRRMERVAHQTSAAIAQEIHDEVININLRMNVASLRTIEQLTDDAAIRSEIQAILEGEQATISMLRNICNQLHLTSLDDPRGLTASLRAQVERVRASWSHWNGAIHLVVQDDSFIADTAVQRVVLRVVREALVNALKHATGATLIAVTLSSKGQLATIEVRDNGVGEITLTAGMPHLGIRSMRESIKEIGGELQFIKYPAGGLLVRLQFGVQRIQHSDGIAPYGSRDRLATA